MLKFSAARLFAERASITIDADNATAVATLCRRLDGLPLAVELADARARTLGVHGLLARIDDRFAMLTGGYHVWSTGPWCRWMTARTARATG